jgi:hypothetical protein
MRDRRRVSLFALLALVAALTLVAAGCGGGSDEAGSDEATIETTTETTTEDTETTEESTETTTDTDVNLGSIANEDCLELASVGAKFSEALSATGGQPDFDTTTKFFAELVDKAPNEIKADLQTLAAAWTEVAAALKGVDLSSGQAPNAETLAKLQEIGNKFNTPKLQQASKHLTAWAKKNCGTN